MTYMILIGLIVIALVQLHAVAALRPLRNSLRRYQSDVAKSQVSCRKRFGNQKIVLRASRTNFQEVIKSKPGKKFIVVTGGVISGIGKGITASSIGVLMKMLQLRPTAIKIDPYLNIDAGTMSPSEHGEVFVLDDGGETDLDLGNYERFLDINLLSDSNLTTGKVYQTVIAKERNGDYLGKTVQIIPHITNEIIDRILKVSQQPVDNSSDEPDVTVIELGGTIGDIESMPFVEALRQLQLMLKPEDFCLVHVSMVPSVGELGEQKTKPTQHSVKELRALGLAPNFIVCRSSGPLHDSAREKIALFCNVPSEHVLSIYDVGNIYEVPLLMLNQNFHSIISSYLKVNHFSEKLDPSHSQIEYYSKNQYLREFMQNKVISDSDPVVRSVNHNYIMKWAQLADSMNYPKGGKARIAMVGKYNVQGDSYLSIVSALRHSCMATNQALDLVPIDALHLEESHKAGNIEEYESAWKQLKSAQGVLIPGGFGLRGVEGKILAAEYARTQKIPYLGICLGMQVAVIEFSRNVLHIDHANSEEFDSSLHEQQKAVIFMPEGDKEKMGGTMRLGSRRTFLKNQSLAFKLYGEQDYIDERHRHRYEVNPSLLPALEKEGLIFSGKDDSHMRMEVIELSQNEHPFYVASQFHPEFKSRPNRPSPLFLGFLQAVLNKRHSGEQ